MCNKIITMSTKRANITNLILFAIIAACLYLVQRIAAFEIPVGENSFVGYRDLYYPEYIIVFAAIVGLSVWYFLVEKKNGFFKPHYPLICLFSIMALISIIIILVTPSKFVTDVPVYIRYFNEDGIKITELDHYKFGCTIIISAEQKILYILISMTSFFALYLILWVLPRKIRYLKSLDTFMYIIILLAVVAIAFSYATELDKYAGLFESLSSDSKQILFGGIASFVANRNSFGMIMAFACFACLFLHHQNHKWWFLVAPIIFTIQTILIGSKTNFVICALTYIIYFVAWLIFRFKKHLVSNLIIIGSIFLVVASVATLITIHHFNNSFMEEVFLPGDKLFNYYIVRVINNENYLSGRNSNYDKAIILLNHSPAFWALGLGQGLYNYLTIGAENISVIEGLHSWTPESILLTRSQYTILSDSPHNSFLQLIGTGGIFSLVIYLLFLIYLLYAMVRVYKKHKVTVLLCLLFFLSAILHGLTESATVFFLSPVYIDSLLFTTFSAIPILSLYYHDKHPSENKKFLANYEQNVQKRPVVDKSSLIAKSLYFFLTPAVILVCIVAPIYWTPNFEDHLGLTIAMITLLGLFIAAPIVAQLISDRKTKFSKFLLSVVLPYYAELIVIGGFIYLYKVVTGPFTLTLCALFVAGVLTGHFVLFAQSSFFNERAGVVTIIMNKVCDVTYKQQKKNIVIGDKEDSLTLEEKIFSYITPKRLRNYETRNN